MYPPIKHGANGPGLPALDNATWKFQKNVAQVWKSQFLIARLHFSMVLLWGQLHRDFLRFADWTSSSGGQHPLLCALSTAESVSCPKSIGSIGGNTIFRGQQYSSCSKAGVCRAAQLLGGFRRDLLIVSWVSPTPGCAANFPGNWCSQPLILRPFGRSGQELSGEYQVEPLFINFSLSTAKKGYWPFASKWRVVFVDPLSPNLHTEGNFQARFSRRKSIEFSKLYRLTSSFFALCRYFDTHFWWQCVMPGVVW